MTAYKTVWFWTSFFMKIADSLEVLVMMGTGGYLILIFFLLEQSRAGGSLILTCFEKTGTDGYK
jgi:hypothetical protein